MYGHRLLRSLPLVTLFKTEEKSTSESSDVRTGLVIGVYDAQTPDGQQELTEAGERLNEHTNGFIRELLKKSPIPLGKAEVFTGLGIQGFQHLAITGLGPKQPNKLNLVEQLNEEKENIRIAMAVGARGVQDRGANRILVDGATIPESAAEGSMLGTYQYKANISTGDKSGPLVELYDHPDTNSWASGEINADAQNWARFLSHAPPNLKKPELFAQELMDKLCKFDVRVDIRNKDWMTLRKMNATISLVKGSSCSPPLLVEIGYCGDDPGVKPIVLVGKGNSFDSGGLFLKPFKGLNEFRADMVGAAAIAGTFMAIARKRLPINVRSAVLLYENLPSPMGLKPGDLVRDKHGVHIRITDPDNDCRVVLSDIITFTDYYSPSMVINVGSFTQSMSDIMGTAASGVFTNTSSLWGELARAGLESGDRVWRMPLWRYFGRLNTAHRGCDIDNASNKYGGDCCQAATFLQEFLPLDNTCCCPEAIPFIHFDNFGTGLISQTEEEIEPYYRKGIKMGRPTRTLIQFLYHRACLLSKKKTTEKEK
ncbi:cytosol aminopeptidase-like [Lycorma delicatula]|uniref:cytosol aminopeptidase-like n=1 Tax=Lycorma delicatula TaxID=130591 RepID=UPI003F50D5F9